MQQYYGDTPHLIPKKRAYTKTKSKKGHGFANFLCFIAVALSLTCLFLALFYNAPVPQKTTTIRARAWYFVSVGAFTDKAESTVKASTAKTQGASGFIINDGAFRVTAAVFSSRSDAVTVAGRVEGEVYTLTVPAIKIKSEEFGDDMGDALDFYLSAYTKITEIISSYDEGSSSDGAVFYALDGLVAECKRIRLKLTGDSFTEETLREYLLETEEAIRQVEEHDGVTLLSNLRYLCCSTVYSRYLTAIALGGEV